MQPGIRTEIGAALTAVALLAPETVAFAQIAGVPPAHGLAAAPLGVLAYAVFGRSRRLIVGATAATAVISSAAVLGLSGDPGQRARLAAALALVTGALLLIAGLLRSGFIAHFLAPEALRGFLFGLALVIVVRQLAVIVDVPSAAATQTAVSSFSTNSWKALWNQRDGIVLHELPDTT